MRAAALTVFVIVSTSSAYAACTRTSTLTEATATAVSRRAVGGYSPRGTFQDCFLVHFGPHDKSRYEASPSTQAREAFLYQYLIVASDAAASVPPNSARAAEYFKYAITAADAYLELVATDASVFSPAKVRDVLFQLGEAYYNRRDVDGTSMQDLAYQYESIAGNESFGTKCFDKRSIDQWERALRCISGSCNAQDAQLEAKIRAERAASTDFVQRCTSFAEFLTIACEEPRFAPLQPRKQRFNRFLRVSA